MLLTTAETRVEVWTLAEAADRTEVRYSVWRASQLVVLVR